MLVDSSDYKALLSLYRYPYNELFLKHLRRVTKYRKEKYSEGNGDPKGYKVVYIAGCAEGT